MLLQFGCSRLALTAYACSTVLKNRMHETTGLAVRLSLCKLVLTHCLLLDELPLLSRAQLMPPITPATALFAKQAPVFWSEFCGALESALRHQVQSSDSKEAVSLKPDAVDLFDGRLFTWLVRSSCMKSLSFA